MGSSPTAIHPSFLTGVCLIAVEQANVLYGESGLDLFYPGVEILSSVADVLAPLAPGDEHVSERVNVEQRGLEAVHWKLPRHGVLFMFSSCRVSPKTISEVSKPWWRLKTVSMVYLKMSPRRVSVLPEGSLLSFSGVFGGGSLLHLASTGTSISETCWKHGSCCQPMNIVLDRSKE